MPNVLVPESLFDGTSPTQRLQTFGCLPSTLRKALARQASDYQFADGLDPVEAWLISYLDCIGELKFDQYPPWAMLTPANADDLPAEPFCRWWGSVGHIRVERDGVSFVPPEAMDISESDLEAFWAVATPVLSEAGWSKATTDRHVLLDSASPLLMEQASPWSVQNIRLTDYFPMNDECASWRKMWLNLQVELNNAEFNQERERKGMHTLNCLWFWGGGHVWPVQEGLSDLKSVSRDGVYQAEKTTSSTDGLLARLLFWKERLKAMLTTETASHTKRERPTIYAVDFDGWGGPSEVFDCLESEVLAPMKMAGLSFSWGLFGQQGWSVLHHNWQSRFKLWQSAPDWRKLIEPDHEASLTEEELRSAWEEGLQDQDQIRQQWDRS